MPNEILILLVCIQHDNTCNLYCNIINKEILGEESRHCMAHKLMHEFE